ncbi:hypothetical protein SZ08_05350, partial [Vibrio parahaemolyticus]
VPHRRADDVHQAGEGEQHEQGQAQADVQLVDQAHRRDGLGRRQRTQSDDGLGPVGEHHHHRAIHVMGRGDDGGEAEDQLGVEHQQDHPFGGVAGGAHPRVGQAAQDQSAQADEAEHAEEAAGDHRQQLLT